MPFSKHVAYDGHLLLLALHELNFGSGAGEGNLRVLGFSYYASAVHSRIFHWYPI